MLSNFFLFLTLFYNFFCEYSKNKVTILHTNDIHGFINGHKHESILDADIAEYYNFIYHIKENGEKNEDEIVLVFDSGDVTQGTGLSDATSVWGEFIYDVLFDLPIDASTIGNHELLNHGCVENIATNVHPRLGNRLVSGNVHYINDSKTMADAYQLKKIPDFGNVLILGFMYNYYSVAGNAIVTNVEEAIKEEWFKRAMEEEDVRIITILGHFSVDKDDVTTIITEIRDTHHLDVPVIFLGGHSHLEQKEVDVEGQVIKIQSYRFFERIGIIQFNLSSFSSSSFSSSSSSSSFSSSFSSFSSSSSSSFSSSFSSFSPFSSSSFLHHKQKNENKMNYFSSVNITMLNTSVFEMKKFVGFENDENNNNNNNNNWTIPQSILVKNKIEEKVRELKLDEHLGCSPMDYINDIHAEHPAYNLLVDEIFPTVQPMVGGKSSLLKKEKDGNENGKKKEEEKGNIYVIATGSLRGQLWKGDITRDDLYILSPSDDRFAAIRNVDVSDIKYVLYYIRNNTHTSNSNSNFQKEKNEIFNHKLHSRSNPIMESHYISTMTSFDFEFYDVIGYEHDIDGILTRLQAYNPTGNYFVEKGNVTSQEVLSFYVQHCLQCDNIQLGNCTIIRKDDNNNNSNGKNNNDGNFFLNLSLGMKIVLISCTVVGFIGLCVIVGFTVFALFRCRSKKMSIKNIVDENIIFPLKNFENE